MNGILIASPYDEFVQISPTKIVRSQKQLSESVINSWKNFLALNSFEAVKNKGPIINICGINDRLLIHHQHGLYITRSKATLNTDIVQVTLGTGDIFQFDPNEVKPAKLGYGGTLNSLAPLLTPIGYIYPDNITGELLLYDGETLHNIGSGLLNFLLKYLTVKDVNNFIGNGILIGYEQFYKRILVTAKNAYLTPGNGLVLVPNYQPTTDFYGGAYLRDKRGLQGRALLSCSRGVNSSIYSCSGTSVPSLGAYTFSSNEHVANGTVIGTVAATGGTGPYSYVITSAITGGLVINPLTGVITVGNTALFDVSLSVLHINIQVTDALGATATGSAAITINHVNSTPVLPAYTVTIPEDTTNGTTVVTRGWYQPGCSSRQL